MSDTQSCANYFSTSLKPISIWEWSLHPPIAPGRYQYRETRTSSVVEVEIERIDGRLWISQQDSWVDFSEFNGEWRRALSAIQK